jgi:hypothetical protein
VSLFGCRLSINSSSPTSVAVTLGSVAAVELFNRGDFSVPGFALCSVVLAIGKFTYLQWPVFQMKSVCKAERYDRR